MIGNNIKKWMNIDNFDLIFSNINEMSEYIKRATQIVKLALITWY